MTTLEPWFLGLLCGLGGLILILLIAITVLCHRWSGKDRRNAKKKAEAAARHTSFTDIVAEQERQEPGIPKTRTANSNWFMQESQNLQTSAEPNGRPKLSGQQPFTVGSSLIQFSQELDNAGPPLMSQNQPVSGAPIQQQTKTPENEEKKIKLGLIPPRQIPRTTSDMTGMRPKLEHKRMSSGHSRTSSGDSRNTLGDTWTTSEHSGPSLASGAKVPVANALDAPAEGGNIWVSLKENEMQIWQNSSHNEGRVNAGVKPYVLPKEDYDLRGAKWYEDRMDPLHESHVQRLREKFSSPKRNEHQTSAYMAQQQPPFRRTNSTGNDFSLIHGNVDQSKRLSLGLDLPTIWQRIPEDSKEMKEEKIKRARRVGVPILPD